MKVCIIGCGAIDRIIHHATIVEIDGESYRKKYQRRT